MQPCLPPAYLLVLADIFFDPEDGGDIFLRNVGATQQTTRRHITEDDTLHNHPCENLKSYTLKKEVPLKYLQFSPL
jgi:hypothetical protein